VHDRSIFKIGQRRHAIERRCEVAPHQCVNTGHEQIGGLFRRTMELSGGAFSINVDNVLSRIQGTITKPADFFDSIVRHLTNTHLTFGI
jgi:hypothetical protein